MLPVQSRATPVRSVVGGLSSSARYAKGLWVRLNGGGGHSARSGSASLGSRLELPLPVSARAERVHAVAALSRSIDSLEQKLQEASKVGVLF